MIDNSFNDAVVVIALIVGYQVDNILIDISSSINIIFKSVFDKMN